MGKLPTDSSSIPVASVVYRVIIGEIEAGNNVDLFVNAPIALAYLNGMALGKNCWLSVYH